MSNNEITPPPELVQQWRDGWVNQSDRSGLWVGEYIATQAARWGADQELEACVNWLLLNGWGQAIDRLRAARRPKPVSLKEQALKALLEADGADHPVPVLVLSVEDAVVIRRALEALPDD